jgi:hypothetical protein
MGFVWELQARCVRHGSLELKEASSVLSRIDVKVRYE